MVKIALVITGALALLAWLFPGLVILGYFLLLLPGLILHAAPTVFLYLLAMWLIRRALPLANNLVAYPAALAIALGIASLATMPLKMRAEAAIAAAQAPDIVASGPIPVRGNVRLVVEDGLPSSFAPSCDALCLALLDSGAEAVTKERGGQTVTYRLRPRDGAGLPPGWQEAEPRLAADLLQRGGQDIDNEGFARYWTERLARNDILVTTGENPLADLVIEDLFERDSNRDIITVAIRQRGARQPLLQRRFVRGRVPLIPPYLTLPAGSAGSGFAGRRFILARREVLGGFTELPANSDLEIVRALALRDYADVAPQLPDTVP